MAQLGRPPKAPKIDRTCETCGKTWQSHSWSKSGIRFCSRACWGKSLEGKPRGPYGTPKKEKSCECCGKHFVTGGQGNPPRSVRFCSRECGVNGRWQGKPGHQKPRQMAPEQVAWFAGIFDGEGCIAWPRRSALQSARLSISNTSLALLKRVEEIVGTGKITDRSSSRKSAKHSPVWVWQCHAANARAVLEQIHPWLIVKREAADVALGLVQASEPPLTTRTLSTMRAEEVL